MRVLVADDEAITRRQLTVLLDHLGHETLEAHDGVEAWAAIHGPDAPPLIILDWMMPAPDGVEICRRLRGAAKRPYQYVIMLTARDSTEDLVEGLEAGADDYLKKPFDLRELRARIRAGERMLALQDEMRAAAVTDELTGLLNRRGIFERLEHELQLVRRDGRHLSVLVADIDEFKAVNDAHGHAVGDEVLKEIGSRMRNQLRAYDDIGRHGGEEFAVVLPACEASDAVTVAERIRRAVCGAPVSTTAGDIAVTISIGVASAEADKPLDVVTLTSGADNALYVAKRSGRNAVEVAWSPQVTGGDRER